MIVIHLLLLPCLVAAQDPKTWMSELSNSDNIRMVTMPGTHDTGTWNEGNAFVACQDWSLEKQLNNGIRFLDIRGRHYKDKLEIHHAAYYQNMNIGNIFDTCNTFLIQNPTEFIVMRIKEEHTSSGNTRSYKETLESYLDNYSSSRFWTNNYLPTVSQARGKVVILEEWDGSALGYPWSSIDLKDDFVVATIFPTDINKKWNGCKEHMDKAKTDLTSSKMFITFTSGAQGGTPGDIAGLINPKLDQYLIESQGEKRLGIVVMDYPSEDLVHMIFQCNFELY